jgi:putative membrane-bound dehydrogenase-like protein
MPGMVRWPCRLRAVLAPSCVLLAVVGLGAVAAGQQDAAAAADPGRRLQVLFVGAPTQNGPHHDPITRYRALKRAVGTDGIDLTYSEEPAAAFTADGLRPFDAVLLYGNWDQMGVMPKAQLDALVAYVEGGGGFVPVHCASACWGRSPGFVKLVGGRFLRHGGEEFAVEDALPSHPALAGPRSFRAWDETYEHDEQGSDRTILQTRAGEPWTWVRTQGQGRVFYTASGHDHRVWDRAEFHALLTNGIRWAVGDAALARLQRLQLPKLEQETVSLPGYKQRQEITVAQKPLSPAESQKLAQVPVGMELRLFASEPDLVNPICVGWDHRGRAYVVETVDYPNNLQKGDLGHDRITVCEDTDGDGRADRFTRFAEKLSIPTSLTFADGGVVCSNGSDILFLRDVDGDLRADERRVLFTGFHMGDTHAGVSNLRTAPDGFVYATVGYSGFGGEVGGVRHDFGQGVFRFRADGSELEFLQHTTNNTWGLGLTSAFDVTGSTANGNPSWYFTFADAAYRAVGMSTHVTPRADDNPFYAPMSTDIRQVDFFDRYTSAAGHAIYTATRFPAAWRERVAFVCEPTGKLVGCFELVRQGAGFRAVQSPNNLFASADAWSSPVCAEVGPDGAVWICDWYNLIIQHNPTPSKGSAGVDAKTGVGNAYETPLRDVRHGRIWRVFPKGTPDDAAPQLAADDPKACVDALGHGNMLWRLHAQRLLVEKDDAAVGPALVALVRADAPLAGMHALHALDQLRLLDDALVRAALGSVHEATRRAAIALASVAVLKDAFVGDGPLPLQGRELAELLVRLSQCAVDPAIGAAILRTGQAQEAAIFDDVTLGDAWRIAARRHAATVVAAADAAGLVSETKQAPVNVLPNRGLEAAAADAPQSVADWRDLRTYGGSREVVVRRAEGQGRSGSNCLMVASERNTDSGVAATVRVQAGKRYRLSGWIKTANVEAARGDGVMLNIHGGVRTAGVKGTSDWTEVSAEFDAGGEGEIVVHCLFGGYGAARGTAWFDDVQLVAIGGGNTLASALQALRATAAGVADDEAPAKPRVHAIDAAVHQRGATVYARTCIACHGLDGRGLPPVFPPLDGSDWIAGPGERVVDVVLHGLMGPIAVNGKRFDAAMAPLGGQLSDQEIADVVTYARQRWSNDAPAVTADVVAARRDQHKARTTPWTAAELDAVR